MRREGECRVMEKEAHIHDKNVKRAVCSRRVRSAKMACNVCMMKGLGKLLEKNQQSPGIELEASDLSCQCSTT